MLKQSCTVCKIVGALAIIGALNWGAVGFLGINVVEKVLGEGMLTRIVYDIVGLAGLALLASYFGVCPSCKK